MPDQVKTAFGADILRIEISCICTLKEVTPGQRKQTKYKQIAASMTHIGLVEPLVVYQTRADQYLLVDGHTRLDILRQGGATTVECLVASDDESYTYNKRVNYLPPIGEHFMILKALGNGVTESRIAEALNVDVAEIRKKRDLLNGICPEAIELLRTKRVTAAAFSVLRRMKPIRQIKCAELMISANSYSLSFVKAFLSVTPDELLVKPPSAGRLAIVPNATKNLMEQEADALVTDLRRAEESYASDMFDLATCTRYFARLLENVKVRRFLTKRHTDILGELDHLIVEVEEETRRQTSPAARKHLVTA